jgi:hypothetical protein
LSEEQTPHIVEKPKNRRDAMEPKEASCGLHTQEVIGSSPVALTIGPQPYFFTASTLFPGSSTTFAGACRSANVNFHKWLG